MNEVANKRHVFRYTRFDFLDQDHKVKSMMRKLHSAVFIHLLKVSRPVAEGNCSHWTVVGLLSTTTASPVGTYDRLGPAKTTLMDLPQVWRETR